MSLAAVSVDLDSLVHYCRIHGLPDSLLDARARDLVYQVAVPRFLELFARAKLPSTLFAIGADLDVSELARDTLRQAHQAGVEIGNHSQTHDYGLSRRDPARILADVTGGAEAIARATGARPRGFRAPGYTLSAPLYAAIVQSGHRYDSSAFPATPYYLAKAAVMGGLWAVRRPSRAVLDSPRVLTAPRDPYWPDPAAPYARGKGTVLELPVTTTPYTGFPFIGTFVATLPRGVIRTAYRLLRGVPLLNFELHAVDLLDEADGIPRALARAQRDLQVPQALKATRIREALRWIQGEFETVTLEAAAQRLSDAARPVV